MFTSKRNGSHFTGFIYTALHGYFTSTQFGQNCRESCINFSENCQSIGNPVNSPTMLICRSIDTNWISSCRSDGGWYCRESDDTETESSRKNNNGKAHAKQKTAKQPCMQTAFINFWKCSRQNRLLLIPTSLCLPSAVCWFSARKGILSAKNSTSSPKVKVSSAVFRKIQLNPSRPQKEGHFKKAAHPYQRPYATNTQRTLLTVLRTLPPAIKACMSLTERCNCRSIRDFSTRTATRVIILSSDCALCLSSGTSTTSSMSFSSSSETSACHRHNISA